MPALENRQGRRISDKKTEEPVLAISCGRFRKWGVSRENRVGRLFSPSPSANSVGVV